MLEVGQMTRGDSNTSQSEGPQDRSEVRVRIPEDFFFSQGGQDEPKEAQNSASTEASSKSNAAKRKKPKGIWSSGKVHSGGCLGTSRR